MSKSEESVLRFVRGERPLAELERAGVFVELTPNGCQIDNPFNIAVTVSPRDVARGILNLRHSPTALENWAIVVLGASNLIDFDAEFETDPLADRLKGVLWDLTFQHSLTEEAVTLSEALSKR